MSGRKAISKALRFEIFKRDSFTCIYCGGKPPKVTLEVDHIIPVSKGGTNIIENLVCSCFDCNRGKRDKDLNNLPTPVTDLINKERLAQYAEYLEFVKEKERLNEAAIDYVCEVYEENHNYEWTPNDSFRMDISKFITLIGIEKTRYAMAVACAKVATRDIPRYFAGVCWNIHRQNNGPF